MLKHKNHNDFISALEGTEIMSVTWNSTSQGILTRDLMPLDYGPSKITCSQEVRYHFYSNSESGMHPVALKAEKILTMHRIGERFRPENIITWVPEWHIVRDWGILS